MGSLWKKSLLLVIASVLVVFPSSARDEQKSPQLICHFGISGVPLAAANYFSSSRPQYDYGTMSGIYSDSYGPSLTTGTFLAGLDIKFNRVVAVCVDLGLNAIWADSYSGISGEKTGNKTGIAVYLVPKAKLYYMDKPLVRMYGTIGLGIGKYFGYTVTSSSFKNPFMFEFQFVPFGIEVGKKVFGFAELGAGTLFMGIHAGVGYKF